MRIVKSTGSLLAAAVALFLGSFAMAEDLVSTENITLSASTGNNNAAPQPCPCPEEEKAPPLPFHCIEGYGGGAITPMAYLVNPGKDQVIGEPAVALSYVNLGSKNLDAITISETLFGRVELSYGADRFGLGSLPATLTDAGLPNIERSEVWLHNFNVRGLLVKENDKILDDLPMPAITLGISCKYNEGISEINDRLGGALTGIGYRSASGQDYTVTATKTFPKAFGRPLVVTAGLRASEAANLGFLGFGDTYHVTFEGNLAYLVTDSIVLAYEFRQKTNVYAPIPGIVNFEDNWHAFDLGLILDKNSTLVFGYGIFGALADSRADSAWYLQFKHEF
jgi:hypothetical protein